MNDYEHILAWLQVQFPNQLMVGFDDVARIYGVSKKTVYNGTGRRAKKKFPVQPTAFGKFKLTDIAHDIAGM